LGTLIGDFNVEVADEIRAVEPILWQGIYPYCKYWPAYISIQIGM
jgi:hypothetical protein